MNSQGNKKFSLQENKLMVKLVEEDEFEMEHQKLLEIMSLIMQNQKVAIKLSKLKMP